MSHPARMDLRRLAAGLLALLLAGCQDLPVEADTQPGVARVFERYRTAAQIERVSETLLGSEPGEGGDVILLSDPKSRVGYEFQVSLERSVTVPEKACFRVEYVRKEGEPSVSRDFPITRQPGWFFGEYCLRLTGADDPGPVWRPVAWRISLVGPDGAVIASRRSFLWGAPTDEPAR